MKKFLITISISIMGILIGFLCLFFVGLNTDSNSLELEDVYIETQSTQDLYNLCTALQESNYHDKISMYYPLLLNDSNFEDFIKCDPYWESTLGDLEPIEIKSIYILAYLDSVFENSGKEKYERVFDEYINQVEFNMHGNSIPILSVVELYYFNETGMEISGLDKKKTEIYLDKLSEYINNANLEQENKNYINLFVYNWYSKINNIDKMNQQRTFVSKMFTNRDFFKWEFELINGYILALNSADNKVLLGQLSYDNYFLIDIGYNIEKYAYNDKYICVLQSKENKENYYIVNTETYEVLGAFEKNMYQQKCKELSIKLELRNIDNNQGTAD
ncbi:MAG: DUF3997 domain-containing protein [Ruminococcaceae bacterium]|nr:DUF3997 domain-containing protein [Oscillospiraceae bacterium]